MVGYKYGKNGYKMYAISRGLKRDVGWDTRP